MILFLVMVHIIYPYPKKMCWLPLIVELKGVLMADTGCWILLMVLNDENLKLAKNEGAACCE
ncbi:importin beta-like SAD2 [Iris pallida]|uniref:Importin beta-like SAD2 n=1 Tax=Iris pallida TaxID=29817 RepID=A0AAX6G132_IRIPA|nr:importin beta-like SAD2 [Iris pallida]